jgi:hypothetical protein
MNLIIAIVMSAAVLIGAAKKKENKWRQLSLTSMGQPAVDLQTAGRTVRPAEMFFGNALCMATKYDLERMMLKTGENGFIRDDADVLVIEDVRPSHMALLLLSRPVIRLFAGIAADAIDDGASSKSEKVTGDGFTGLIEIVELDPSVLPEYELARGKGKQSPYFIIERELNE